MRNTTCATYTSIAANETTNNLHKELCTCRLHILQRGLAAVLRLERGRPGRQLSLQSPKLAELRLVALERGWVQQLPLLAPSPSPCMPAAAGAP